MKILHVDDNRFALDAMREINPGVRIIFATVFSEHEVACELSGLPVSGFLPKPWKPEKLAEVFADLRRETGREQEKLYGTI